ncbi:MAG: DUF309 domain-containing protein [Thermoplasmatales archaeon]|nr:DUF309 domain-containing protein [Thermoplasmatales archaeon]MCW6171080.1 DUF309 domain-containing protein [Thermoplasmatales archaeon]
MRVIFHIYDSNNHNQGLEELGDDLKKIIIRKNTHGFELDVHTEEAEKSIEAVRSLFCVGTISFPNSIEQAFRLKKQLNNNRVLEVLKFSESLMLQERFWESHVILEELWKSSNGKVKSYFQGLILISASMVHFQMGKTEKAFTIYRKALQLIKSSGIDSPILDTIPQDFSYPIALNFELMFPNNIG